MEFWLAIVVDGDEVWGDLVLDTLDDWQKQEVLSILDTVRERIISGKLGRRTFDETKTKEQD